MGTIIKRFKIETLRYLASFSWGYLLVWFLCGYSPHISMWNQFKYAFFTGLFIYIICIFQTLIKKTDKNTDYHNVLKKLQHVIIELSTCGLFFLAYFVVYTVMTSFIIFAFLKEYLANSIAILKSMSVNPTWYIIIVSTINYYLWIRIYMCLIRKTQSVLKRFGNKVKHLVGSVYITRESS